MNWCWIAAPGEGSGRGGLAPCRSHEGTQSAGRAGGAQPPKRVSHLPGDTQHPGARSRQGLSLGKDTLLVLQPSAWEGIPGFPRSFGPWLISPCSLKGFGVTVLPRNTTVWVFVYCWDLSSFSFQPANVVLPLLGRLKSPLLLS